MTIDHSVLKDELETDPTSLGLTALYNAGSDNKAADVLNQRSTKQKMYRNDIAPVEILACIVASEWPAVSADYRDLLLLWFSQRIIDARQNNVRDLLSLAFGSAPETQVALNALILQQRNASRAESLFGPGTLIDPVDIAIARKVSK